MKFCEKCGSQMSDEATACRKCGAVVAGVPASEKVPDHMIGAVLSAIFCCLTGGIVSIAYALKVRAGLARGDADGARAASGKAKSWIVVNLVVAPFRIALVAAAVGLFLAAGAAKRSAEQSAAAMRGRRLFVGIVQASVNREAAGLRDLWPRTAGSSELSDDGNDIAGIPFENSTDYFRTLFDVASAGEEGRDPYVDVDIGVLKLSENGGFCDWIVAANVKEEFDDVIPVLVSANVDPSVLNTSFDGRDDTPIPFGSDVGRTKLPWCDRFVVVIRKGGWTEVFKRRYFTRSMLYKRQSFSAPGLKYLDVE